MTNATPSGLDRDSAPRRFRTPLAVAGAAVLGLSLVVGMAPALAAAKNGGTGGGSTGSSNVKVHDASTGVETLGSDNEPHVCAFWLEFTMPAPYEAGAWALLSWPPTGDGSTIVAGAYDTTGDGTDATSVIEVSAGHYRVEWAATGQTVTKKKTFWVDAGCADVPTPPAETQAVEPTASAEASPAEGSPAEETPLETPPSPAETPADTTPESAAEVAVAESPADESPTEASGSPVELPAETTSASPADETPADSPTDEPTTQAQESVGPDGPPAPETPAPTDEQGVLSEGGTESTPPLQEPDVAGESATEASVAEVPVPGSGAEESAGPDGAAATEPGTPGQDQLDSQADPGEPTMADTAASQLPISSGLLATLMLLALVVIHGSAHRARRDDDRA